MTWDRWIARWERAIAACERRGGDTRLRIGPPAALRDLVDLERRLGTPLPRQFRDVLLGFSGEVEYFWFLPEGAAAPEPLAGVICGICSWSLETILNINEELAWLAVHGFVDDEPEHRLWQDKFAFHKVASGDFLAFDVSKDSPQPVVYLNHDHGDSHGLGLGPDFLEFMDRWTMLGCPDDDVFKTFVPKGTHFIDPFSPNARSWCRWFGLPEPDST